MRKIDWNYLSVGLVVAVGSLISFFIHAFIASYVIENPDTWFMWATGVFLAIFAVGGIVTFFFGIEEGDEFFLDE